MSYVEQNLLPGEKLLHRGELHWIIYAPGFVFLITAAAFYFVTRNNLSAVLALLGLLMLAKSNIQRQNTEFAVTNRRVIVKTGWFAREALDMALDRIESVLLEQTFWGRMLDYGTLIVHGTGGGSEALSSVQDPLSFRKTALAAIEDYKNRTGSVQNPQSVKKTAPAVTQDSRQQK